ncbi:MAG: sigma-70 family RNA polymerase sigma factor [Symbiobacteriia bacterium]
MDAPELWQQYRATGSRTLRDEILGAHLELVRHVAGRVALVVPASVSLADLEGCGVLGLLDAVERYDPTRGVPFAAYAITRIRGAILDGLRDMDQAPTAWRQRARLLEQAAGRLESRLGRDPEDGELAEELGLSRDELAEWEGQAARLSLVYLDQIRQGQDGEEEPEAQPPTDRGEDDPVAALLQRDRGEALAQAIGFLSEKERLVVSLIYYEGLTAREAALVMGLSPSRVSQLHTRAILRLRVRLSRRKGRVL